MFSRSGLSALQSVQRGYRLCTIRFATSTLTRGLLIHGNDNWRSVAQLPRSTAFRHMSVLNSHSKANDDSEANAKAASTGSSLKGMWNKYGMVFVGTYLGIYVSCLGGMFVALDNDIFYASSLGVDPIEAVHKACDMVEKLTGNDGMADYIRKNPRVGTFAIGWVLTKVLEPLRLALAVAVTPSIARAIRRSDVPSADAK